MNKLHYLSTIAVFGSVGLFTTSASAENETNFGASLVIDYSTFDVAGQIKDNAIRGLIDLSLESNLGNLTVFANSQIQRGEDGSEYVGDIQAFSNIDESDFSKLYEIWLQYRLDNLDGVIKVGYMDLNADFAFADNAGEFINSSMGFSPTILELPTYPDPAAGLSYTQTLNEHNQIAVAVAAGKDRDDFDDLFSIAQWQYSKEQLSIRLGVWHHNGQFVSMSGNRVVKGTEGYFFVAENTLPSLDIGYYVQFGSASASVAEITRHYGIGFYQQKTQWDKLSWGIGATLVELNSALATADDHELALELFAKYQLSDHFVLKPDLQWISSPSGESRDEMVFTMRFEFGF